MKLTRTTPVVCKSAFRIVSQQGDTRKRQEKNALSMASSKQSGRHDLDDAKLGEYLQQHVPNLQLPVVSTKIGYGQSNPTYFVDDAAKVRFILRKKPSGTIISPVAHQVDREYKVLKALGQVESFPVPKVYCLCMDASVIGTAFYVSCTTPNATTIKADIAIGHGIRQRPHHYRPQPLHFTPNSKARSMVLRNLDPSLASFN